MLALGTRFGTYELLSPIGVGSMESAGHPSGPHHGDKDGQITAHERLKLEARIIVALNHPYHPRYRALLRKMNLEP